MCAIRGHKGEGTVTTLDGRAKIELESRASRDRKCLIPKPPRLESLHHRVSQESQKTMLTVKAMAIEMTAVLTSAFFDGKSKSRPCGKRRCAKGGGARLGSRSS